MPAFFNQHAIEGVVTANGCREVFHTHGVGCVVQLAQALLHVAGGKQTLHFLIETLHHLGRCVAGCIKAEHGHQIGLVKAKLTQCGQLGVGGRACRAGGGQHAQLALLDQCVDGCKRVGQQQVKLCACGIGDQLAAAFVGHVHKVAAGGANQLLHHDVGQRAVARSSYAHALAGASLCQYIVPCLACKGCGGQHQHGGIHHAGNGLYVLQRVVGHWHQVGVERQRADGAKGKSVGIIGLGQFRHANGGASPRLVFHHKRLAQTLGHEVAKHAGDHVIHTASRVGHDHADGLAGPWGAGMAERAQAGGSEACACQQKGATCERACSGHGESRNKKPHLGCGW